ncbi:hypothetical protein [Agromyces sp. LHK192]|uniref:hypothetical protein n=1 Tax=Agromyces sp. LHK192 TaxID=2498704 RepID=UPI00196A93E9|nr:hypothetical protein [Agromyces sp. LHK192]
MSPNAHPHGSPDRPARPARGPRPGLLARLRGDEHGAALAVVLGLSLVMLILIAIGASWSLSGLRKSAHDNDWSAALAAAYAGADEYTSRLSNDATYVKYGNPAAPFTVANGSAASVALPPPAKANPAFDATAAGAWASVPGSDGRSWFRYEVDNADYDRTGAIRIRSTGRVGDQTRSIVVNIKQKGFIDYIYFTDYEFADPLYSSSSCTPQYEHVGSGHDGDCTEIQFMPGDEINGPLHSNDTPLVCESTFNGPVTTADPRAANWRRASGCGNPTWHQNVPPQSVDSVGMPPTNTEMKNETRVDLPDTVARPGCLYTGPTTILFNSNGTMTVVSPWTKVTQPSYTAGVSSQSPAACGSIAALNSYAGATIPVLDSNLVFVQDVPSAAGTDPNRPSSSSWRPDRFSCTGSGASQGWEYRQGTGATPRIGYPYSGGTTATTETAPGSPQSTSSTPAYDCDRGDLFVRGTVNGAITLAATNVYVTGDLRYADAADDMLGLVGQNSVWVWNPMRSSTPINPNGTGNRRIDAAILSVAHVFQAQNYSTGGFRGDLIVTGAIAQKFRGIVTQGGNGYDKDYNYDDRFRNVAPPKFLTPTSTTYGVTQYASTAAAFRANGAPN